MRRTYWRVFSAVAHFLHSESAPTMVEYGLLLMCIALVVLAAVGLVGQEVLKFFESFNDSFPG